MLEIPVSDGHDDVVIHNDVGVFDSVEWAFYVSAHRAVPVYGGDMDGFHLELHEMLVPPLDPDENPHATQELVSSIRKVRRRAEVKNKRQDLTRFKRRGSRDVPAPIIKENKSGIDVEKLKRDFALDDGTSYTSKLAALRKKRFKG